MQIHGAPHRCGVVLAAGEGRRLELFVQRLCGHALPKQYVNFIGARSMLEHTFERAESFIAPQRIFTVVSKAHLSHTEVRRQLSRRPQGTVVTQPENKETAPGLLLPLMHIYKRYPDATVVVFPSDHFIVEEELFTAHVALACRVVERLPGYLILLGIEPDEPESEYGYILPGEPVERLAPLAVRRIARFREKPDRHTAREFLLGGGLWNTMVMIFKVETLLELVCEASPELWRVFLRIHDAIGTAAEAEAVETAYKRIAPMNFSTGLLEAFACERAARLLVLPVHGVFWSDWGSERRIVAALRKLGYLDRLNGWDDKSCAA